VTGGFDVRCVRDARILTCSSTLAAVPRELSGVRHWRTPASVWTHAPDEPQEVDVHAALLAAEEAASVAIPPAGVGLIAFGGLVALLALTYVFRNVSNRN